MEDTKHTLRDGPVENLWGRGGGGGGAGEVQKKGEKGKIKWKKFLLLKKIHTRNLITKKIPAARKFPSPP